MIPWLHGGDRHARRDVHSLDPSQSVAHRLYSAKTHNSSCILATYNQQQLSLTLLILIGFQQKTNVVKCSRPNDTSSKPVSIKHLLYLCDYLSFLIPISDLTLLNLSFLL